MISIDGLTVEFGGTTLFSDPKIRNYHPIHD